MFTGLIEETGKILSLKSIGGGKRITVAAKKIMDDLKIDDSVAINGACQTVVAFSENSFTVEAVEETLRKTTLKLFRPGAAVNLERAAKLGDRLGGHIVQGHVDTTGNVKTIQNERTAVNLWIEYPTEYSKYIIPVGSIAINGVSLTVAKLQNSSFMVSVIPHTWKVTTLSQLSMGMPVNLEFDLIGKYVENMVNPHLRKNSDTESSLRYLIDQPDF